jgi:hypothetical protein
VLTPEYTPTPPPEGYPTIEPRYVGQILISSGGQIEPYVPTEIRLDQLPTTLSGNLIQPQALWPFGESDFDLLQWAADTIEW